MTKREAMRQTMQSDTLRRLGFTDPEAESLRRISMTLHRWYERECGTDGGAIERDATTGKPYWYNAMSGRRSPVADRETGAVKRLQGIVEARNRRAVADGQHGTALGYYLQTDPRGASLYILRPGDVPDGADEQSYYSRGICVY